MVLGVWHTKGGNSFRFGPKQRRVSLVTPRCRQRSDNLQSKWAATEGDSVSGGNGTGHTFPSNWWCWRPVQGSEPGEIMFSWVLLMLYHCSFLPAYLWFPVASSIILGAAHVTWTIWSSPSEYKDLSCFVSFFKIVGLMCCRQNREQSYITVSSSPDQKTFRNSAKWEEFTTAIPNKNQTAACCSTQVNNTVDHLPSLCL